MKFSTLFAAVCLFAAFGRGQAQTPAAASGLHPAVRIGIINIQIAIANTQEGKADEAALKTRFTPQQQRLQAESAAITALQKKLQAGGDTLSPEAKSDLASTIATKQKELRNDVADTRNDYQNAMNDMINKIGQKMVLILANYAKLHHLSMVLDHSLQWPQNPILYATPTIDITQVIVNLYNQKYPVSVPAAPASAPAPKPHQP